MSESQLIYNILVSYYNITNDYYNKKDTSIENLKKFRLAKKLYTSVSKTKEVFNLRMQIKNIKKELETTKDAESREVIIAFINAYDKRIKEYSRSINDIEHKFIENKPEDKKVEAKKEIKPEEKKPIIPEEKKLSPTAVNNEYIKKLHEYSAAIIKLEKQLNILSPESKEAMEIRKSKVAILEEREDYLLSCIPLEQRNDAVNALKNLESLEKRYVLAPDGKEKEPYELTASDVETKLKKILNEYGNIAFYEEKSKLLNFKAEDDEVKKYIAYRNKQEELSSELSSIIYAIYGKYNVDIESSSESKEKIESDKISSILSNVNLEGGFEPFKKKHNNGIFSGKAIDKPLYDSVKKYALSVIEGLCQQCKSEIVKKGNKVTVTDRRKYKKDIQSEIDKYLNELSNKMTVVKSKGL